VATHTHSDLSGDEISDYAGPIQFRWKGADYDVDLTTAESNRFGDAKHDLVNALQAAAEAEAMFAPFLAAARYVPPSEPAAPVEPVAGESPKAPRKPRTPRKATAATKTARTPAKSRAKAFSPPAEDLVLPADAPVATNGKTNPADVRAWAKDQGQIVPARGRLPMSVTAAYAAAH
jgi:hypothetical protein